MKRELKEQCLSSEQHRPSAAAQIPMKRELKASSPVVPLLDVLRCSPNPYEEGTESNNTPMLHLAHIQLQPKSL